MGNSKQQVFNIGFIIVCRYHNKADAIGAFMFRLREMDQLPEHFDERLWMDTVDRVTVFKDGGMLFKFQNGSELAEQNNCIGVNK